MNKLASEYMDMKNAFGLMKQKIDQNNSQIELQTLKSRVDTIAQSIRYLTLSLQSHEIHDEETNMTIYREFEHIIIISYKLMNEIQKVHNYTVSESKDIHDLLTVQQGRILTLRSELASLKHLNSKLMNEKSKIARGDPEFNKYRVFRHPATRNNTANNIHIIGVRNSNTEN